MDNIDLKILDILQNEGRVTMKELGSRVGLTSPATIERVKKLEDSGIIKGYNAKLDKAKAGLDVHVFFRVRTDEPAAAFAEFIKQRENIYNCYRLADGATYLMEAAVPNIAELEKMVDALMSFGNVDTDIVLNALCDQKPVVLP